MALQEFLKDKLEEKFPSPDQVKIFRAHRKENSSRMRHLSRTHYNSNPPGAENIRSGGPSARFNMRLQIRPSILHLFPTDK
jgi:hypothetical protein